MNKRFTGIDGHGREVIHAGTYDEAHTRILKFHRELQHSLQFRVPFDYTVRDNHEES